MTPFGRIGVAVELARSRRVALRPYGRLRADPAVADHVDHDPRSAARNAALRGRVRGLVAESVRLWDSPSPRAPETDHPSTHFFNLRYLVLYLRADIESIEATAKTDEHESTAPVVIGTCGADLARLGIAFDTRTRPRYPYIIGLWRARSAHRRRATRRPARCKRVRSVPVPGQSH